MNGIVLAILFFLQQWHLVPHVISDGLIWEVNQGEVTVRASECSFDSHGHRFCEGMRVALPDGRRGKIIHMHAYSHPRFAEVHVERSRWDRSENVKLDDLRRIR